MKVLVVEDNILLQQLYSYYLEGIFEFDISCDGLSAFEIFKEAHENGNPYSIIIIDCHMPVMNGIDAVEMMRKYEVERGIEDIHISKIIMVSSDYELKDEVVSNRSLFVHNFLCKPVLRETLISAISQVCSHIINRRRS